MGDSVTPEVLGEMIRRYFSQALTEEETIQCSGQVILATVLQ
ncbi:chromosome partitioning protein ParB [Escherichia coli]|nr:chromosome partitioning protein ParB [Escherichia coli]TGJ43747.1 chromosome partitioning protein ParB [Escherichia coli]